MKQIILITDGCSNVGVSPVVAAAQALTQGISVNVIGVIDHGEIGELGAAEIEEIARAGGGMSRIVGTGQLSQTVQMVTRHTVAHTIQQAVNRQLQHILGESTIAALPPEQRGQVVQAMDDLGETAALQVALLVDASASMKPKLPAVEEAIRDLALSLQSREGHSEIAVLHFPGPAGSGAEYQLDLPWTHEIHRIKHLFQKLNARGTTPTGPALLKAAEYINQGESSRTVAEDRGAGKLLPGASKGGMLSDYIV
ncbi:hypothetical protein SY83_06430 [Paenibacillus swuensis]|uniref:VWFA domain-containing protein n=1 Tax=Paenibacillus swuensis TaxID=1178515 RepID=A0A172TG43_9BACL|nr:VWA domain-containing protein [Paenibacillus swuensis]ANE45980.1 hypothetical protein SY83_06430 [Paenibacillus swuensis]